MFQLTRNNRRMQILTFINHVRIFNFFNEKNIVIFLCDRKCVNNVLLFFRLYNANQRQHRFRDQFQLNSNNQI